MKGSDCILVYGSTTKGGVVKGSECILVYGSTTKGGVVKRSDCILLFRYCLCNKVATCNRCNQHITYKIKQTQHT